MRQGTARHLLIIVITAVVLAGAAAGSGRGVEAQQDPGRTDGSPSAGEPEFVPGEIVVKLEEDASPQDLATLNRRNEARVEEDLPLPDASVVDLPAGLGVEEAARRYESSPAVAYAEPNFILEPNRTPDDTYYARYQYALNNTGQTGGVRDADIDAQEAWNVTTGKPGVMIAVIDSGVQIGHGDLQNNIWKNPKETINGEDDDGNGYVDDVNGWDFHGGDRTVYDDPEEDGHGTHVAGILAAQGNNGRGVTGVSWRASIMPLKFIGPNSGSTSDAIKAIEYAVVKGAKISNNSWGNTFDNPPQSLCDTIAKAGKKGHLFVASAGNNGTNNDGSTKHYPSSCAKASDGAEITNVISVAATDDEDRLASFSNYGKRSVHLGAPGVSILSPVPGGYGFKSGTSMAAPHVAGVAALLKSRNPGWDAARIKRQILQGAERKNSLRDRTVTGGRLNAARALGLKVTNLSLSAKPRTITYGKRTGLSGRLAAYGGPVGGRKVVLDQRPVGAKSFRRVGETTTVSDGRFRFPGRKPHKNGYYRVRFAGAGSFKPSTSPARRVDVRVAVSLNTARKNLKLGRKRAVSGVVRPKHAGAVTVAIKRNGKLISRKKVSLNRYSRYRFVYKPRRPGTYAFFATYPKHGDHLGNRSPQKKFKVVR
jgi:subtilisin family serine protease